MYEKLFCQIDPRDCGANCADVVEVNVSNLNRLSTKELMLKKLKFEVSARMAAALKRFGKAISKLKPDINECSFDKTLVVLTLAGAYALVVPFTGVKCPLLERNGGGAGWEFAKGINYAQLKRQLDESDDFAGYIVSLGRLHHEQVCTMMSCNKLSEQQLRDMCDAYNIDNTTEDRFKDYIYLILNDLKILDFIGKTDDEYPKWVDKFQRLALENTSLGRVVVYTPQGKVKKLAVICWADHDKKTTRVIHFISDILEHLVRGHKRWTSKKYVKGRDLVIGGMPWFCHPLRLFVTNTEELCQTEEESEDERSIQISSPQSSRSRKDSPRSSSRREDIDREMVYAFENNLSL